MSTTMQSIVRLGWTLINDITQRKSANKGKLAGETEKERIENW